MRFLIILIVSSCLFSCQNEEPKKAFTSFYYWKQTLKLSSKEKKVLRDRDVSKLYVRFFDVAYKGSPAPVPHADLKIVDSSDLKDLQIVACVFIANEVFQKSIWEEIDTLADRVAKRLMEHCEANSFLKVIEVQIDCDWNKSTRDKYFSFLKALKELVAFPLSVTIRLHQVKYASATGIPPVLKGVLMSYNMSPPQKYGDQNSIFDLQLMKSYTKQIESYPMKLDIGLPIYSWGVVFRKKKFNGFINGLTKEDLKDRSKFNLTEERLYTCINSCNLNSKLLFRGDEIRLEKVSNDELRQAKKWFLGKFPYPLTYIFYHLEEQNLNHHEDFFN